MGSARTGSNPVGSDLLFRYSTFFFFFKLFITFACTGSNPVGTDLLFDPPLFFLLDLHEVEDNLLQ